MERREKIRNAEKNMRKNNTLVWCENTHKRYNKMDFEKYSGIMTTFPDERRTTMNAGKRKKRNKITITLSVVLVLLIILLVVLAGHKRSLAKQEAAKKAEAKAEKGLELPYQFDDGKLEMKSIFSYAGPNPDNNAEEGDNIAAIQMTNCSDTYLASAKITVTVGDGTKLTYQVEALPAGKTVTAFEVQNQELPDKPVVKKIDAKTQYSNDVSLHEDALTITVEDTNIGLTNISQEAIQNMTVFYHDVMDDEYFGGKSYQKTVESLAAGESTTVTAEECYIGEAAVAGISY